MGVTNDLSRRVWERKEGRGSEHAQRYGIDRLVYYENYPDMRDAIQRECNLKHWSRASKTKLIFDMNPAWRDLCEDLNM